MRLAIEILFGLIFFALILVSVGLHEVGHFVPGKLFKVRILQFFIGFGKNIWKKNINGTEYGVKMIPLGGYVQLLGMYPPAKEGKNTRWKRLADSAREAEWESITEDDIAARHLFYQKPLWQRLIIMFCGVFMNLLLAFLLFQGVNLAYGQPVTTTTIASVSQCVNPAPAACVQTPAAAMGLQAGDQVVAFNGTTYDTWADLTAAVRANGAGTDQLTVIRNGTTVELPQVQGVIATVADPNNPNNSTGIQAGYLGVTAAEKMVPVGPIATIKQMGSMIGMSVVALVKLPVTSYHVLVGMITGQPRDPNGPISILGASVIAGDVASASNVPLSARVATYVQLLGSINLFVGIMNLVPLPPFDGGQIAAGIYEAIRRGWAKLRGKPDPGPADTARLLPLTYVVTGLLIIIGAIMIIADIISPVKIF